MNFIYRKACLADIPLLTESRVMVLRAANKLSEDADLSLVEKESYEYYRKSLEDGSHTAFLVFDGEKLIGTGGISFYKVMPTCDNPTGHKANIMNMYTAPEYRRLGIAFETLHLLVNEALGRSVTYITLEATDVGRPLYEKFGFVKMEHEMKLIIPR